MKKSILSTALATILWTALVLISPNVAMAEEPVWTKGKVTKIDKELGKVTIKHEEIKNLDMPAMRMIFRVADPKMLDQLKTGQKGEFYIIDANGRLVIKQIK